MAQKVALLCGAARWHFPALPPCSHLLGLLRSTPSLTTTRIWEAIYTPVGCIVYINANLDSKIKVKRLINTYSGSSTSLALPLAHLICISNTTAACPRFPAYAKRQLRWRSRTKTPVPDLISNPTASCHQFHTSRLLLV